MDTLPFDVELAIECARAFAGSTGLGCTVSLAGGEEVYEAGPGCISCPLCALAGKGREKCIQTHIYGMTEAERFGGKYIYFCEMGLACFVSPIVGAAGSAAKITVGPFLMVEADDYLRLDLVNQHGFDGSQILEAQRIIQTLPHVPPEKVDALSTLLFMSVGFLNNVAALGDMLDARTAGAIQGRISAFVSGHRREGQEPYPYDEERRLLEDMLASRKEDAGARLNTLLGHILLSSGGDLTHIKVRVFELLTQISRAAMQAGASPEYAFSLSVRFYARAQEIQDLDRLCFLITDVTAKLIDSVFSRTDIRHVDVMHKALAYIRGHYAERLTLDEVAREVFLSPSYFGRLFRQEMGQSFSVWLYHLRIEESKPLLLENMRIADVAAAVGFRDQSYFTKVFRKVTGHSPQRYRERGGRL